MSQEALKIGDRVRSDDSVGYVGTVLAIGLDLSKDRISVQLDEKQSVKLPPGMSLFVGGRENDWIKQ